MEHKNFEEYGKIAYESNISNVMKYGNWEELNAIQKRYWTDIAIVVIDAYKKWSENLTDH